MTKTLNIMDADAAPETGRQISWMALQAMGMTPGDVADIMANYRYDSGLKAGGLEKMGRTMEQQGSDSHADQFLKDKDEQMKREEGERRQEAQRQTDQQLEQKRQDELTWQEKQRLDQQMIEKRAQQEQANANIMKGAATLALFPLGLGLAAGAMEKVGGLMDSAMSRSGDTMMVTSNNNGGMLASMRGALGLDGPATDKLITGPNAMVDFVPGQQAPEATFTAAPNLNADNPLNRLPGLSGPSPRMS